MRKISEKTVLTALVNYKCVGMFGKAITHLSKKERAFVIDRLIRIGYLDEDMNITKKGDSFVLNNLSLSQY